MPELPEVENVKRSMERLGSVGQEFAQVELLSPKLRTQLKASLKKQLPGQKIKKVYRRAKYLLFETDDFVLLNHLGMTGSWRALKAKESREKHDHVVFNFRSGLVLVYNDPRRFGILEIFDRDKIDQIKWLSSLAIEPWDKDFNGDYLFNKTRGVKSAIKSFVMDQRKVVGVGNIYASEALYRVGIRPTRPAGRMTRVECERLAVEIKNVLEAAIQAGGSTIRDYRNSEGELGGFQNHFLVYGRDGEMCGKCKALIRSKFLVGRNTYWCPKCQR